MDHIRGSLVATQNTKLKNSLGYKLKKPPFCLHISTVSRNSQHLKRSHVSNVRYQPVVFMNHPRQGQCVILIFFIVTDIQKHAQATYDETSEQMTPEFVNFLRSLGSEVYKDKVDLIGPLPKIPLSTTPSETKRRHAIFHDTQNAAIGDILMLKLVSYYEDKYRVSPHPLSNLKMENITSLDNDKTKRVKIIRKTREPSRTIPLDNEINDNKVPDVIVM